MSRLCLLIACSTSLMGCILRDFDYEPPPNLPPSVHGSIETPLDKIYLVDRDLVPGGDAGFGPELEFVANVRDANVDQQLIGFVFLDRSESNLRPYGEPIPIPVEQDETPRERRVAFSVTRSDIRTNGCHSVELHVSSDFDTEVTNPQPHLTDDLGVGVWWIAASDASATTTQMDMRTCPRRQSL